MWKRGSGKPVWIAVENKLAQKKKEFYNMTILPYSQRIDSGKKVVCLQTRLYLKTKPNSHKQNPKFLNSSIEKKEEHKPISITFGKQLGPSTDVTKLLSQNYFQQKVPPFGSSLTSFHLARWSEFWLWNEFPKLSKEMHQLEKAVKGTVIWAWYIFIFIARFQLRKDNQALCCW